MRNPHELEPPSREPASTSIAPLRPFMAGRRAAGAVGVMLAVPPVVFGVLFMADLDADGGGARDAWEQALMAASALFVLAVHACALLALLRESRSHGRAGASEC